MTIEPMSEKFAGMLRDESRMEGHVDAVARPRDYEQLAQAVKYAAQNGMRVTMQGAATGVEGGAVPHGGLLISTRGMNRILGLRECEGKYFLRVQAGVTLEQMEEYLRKPIDSKACFFPPNPTEKTATLGGAFASDAIGTRGRVRDHVGDVLWIGGIIAELELALRPVPGYNWGVLLFFTSPGDAKVFTQSSASIGFAGHAYFDAAALALLRTQNANIPIDACDALYLALSGENEAAIEAHLTELLGLYLDTGGRDEYAWAAEGPAEMEKFQAMCHAVPELVNSELDRAGRVQPGLCKAALDKLYMNLCAI